MMTVDPVTSPPTYDVATVRRDFPILDTEVRGHPLSYLDNAASTQKPNAVIDAVSRFYRESYANVHRGVHTLSQRATDAYEGARDRVASFLGASDRREVVFVRGATEGINLVASSWARPRLGPGDEILVTEMEHHSNIVPWQLVAEATGATVVPSPIDDRGRVDLDAFSERLGPKTRIVGMAHVSNALGTVNPVREMAARAREAGAFVLVDGAQAAPHRPIDVASIGCDAYVVSAHKMYGPSGVGALWVRGEILDAMPPYQGGGEMILRVSFEGTRFAPPPARFEAGTPNIAGAVGFGAAIEYLEGLGLERVAAHEDRIRRSAEARLAELPGVRIVGTADEKAAVVSFVVDGIHPHDLGTVLDAEGVAIRAGHHCAQPVMDRFGVPATARASFGLYSTPEEVDRLVAGVERAIDLFGGSG